MKFLACFTLLLLPGICRADIFILKDGARIEGEVTGQLDDTVLVQTKYGSLTINNADIQEQKPAQPAPAAEVPTVELSSASAAETEISTASPVAVSTAQPTEAAEAAPEFTFITSTAEAGGRRLAYMDNGVIVATETFDTSGSLTSLEGSIPNGTYMEYYPDGSLKTAKTMLAGKPNGTLKTYYPSGEMQVEAYYLAGQKDGQFKYYTETGTLLMEASYKNDLLDGWKKEYAPGGALISQIYYSEDSPAEAPKPEAAASAETAAPPAPESLVTVQTTELARGERFAFKLNNKHIGKLTLDSEFNLLRKNGKIPDGTAKEFSKDGTLLKEFVFEANELQLLRVHGESGAPAEYTYIKDKAIKK